MNNVLAVTYSQAGQTARAIDSFLTGLNHDGSVSIKRLDLGADEAVRPRYKMPWPLFDFLEMLPAAYFPGRRPVSSMVELDGVDTLVLAYPVWFLHPAPVMRAFLDLLPPSSLSGKSVITICTCRNMWYGAQKQMRKLVEARGGRVVSHVALEDRGPTVATLVTTPRYFLTGKKEFTSPVLKRLLPRYGITDGDYAALRNWAGRYPVREAAAKPSFFELNTSLALAETVGRYVFRALLIAWPLLRSGPKAIRNVYLVWVALCSLIAIITLLPPLAILGGLPPIRRRLKANWERLLVSSVSPAPEQPVGAAAGHSASGRHS